MNKELLTEIGFAPKDGTSNVYSKIYENFDDYLVEVDLENEKIDYGKKIKFDRTTTQNFADDENWVVLECVDRLLSKGYKPEDIVLEKKFTVGHGASGGWLDIIVKKSKKAYLMIECKTWGTEFDKEFKKLQKDGGQLLTYFQQDTNAEYLILYTSRFDAKEIQYRNEIIKIEEDYREAGNVKDLYERWNKLTKQNGIFEDWVTAYEFQSKALTKEDLKIIKQEDSSFIFNRFLEILRRHVVSDKPNAFNKIFTLFLCKIVDEDRTENEQLHFQWLEGEDDNISFQKRLTDLYKRGMSELLSKEVTDMGDEEFNKKFGLVEESQKKEFLRILTEIRLKKNNEFAFKEVFDDESFEENAKVVKDVVELLQKYQIRYNKKHQYLGDFFELLLTTGLKQESGQFFTPVPVARYIIKSLPTREIAKAKFKSGNTNDLLPTMIDYAAGSGHFLTESMDEMQQIIDDVSTDEFSPQTQRKLKAWKDNQFDWAYDYVYGIEKDYRLVKTAKVSCYLHGDGLAKVIHADGLGAFDKESSYRGKLKERDRNFPQDNKQFDIVVSNPPYSVSAFKGSLEAENAENDFELFDKLTDQSSEIECLFIERTKQLLKDGGVAGIILPSSILSNTGIYTKTREIILKYFEVIGITKLGSATFMATGTNTVVLFLRRRNNYDWRNVESAVVKFFTDFRDVTVCGVENVFSKYVDHVWEDVNISDYVSLCKKKPNEKIEHHELFIEYKKNLERSLPTNATQEVRQKMKELFWKDVLSIEQEKLLYFILTYKQEVVLTRTGDKKAEKQFLGYEFSTRRGHEGTHPIQRGKSIDECTSLFDPNTQENGTKASFYNYKNFLGEDFEIDETMQNNVSVVDLVDMVAWGRADFEKIISLNVQKKIKVESKWEQVTINHALEEVTGETTKIAKSKILKNGENPVVTQEQGELVSGFTNEKNVITDLPLILFGDHSCTFKYIDFNFFRGADGTVLLKPNDRFNAKYFFIF